MSTERVLQQNDYLKRKNSSEEVNLDISFLPLLVPFASVSGNKMVFHYFVSLTSRCFVL